MIPFRIHSTQSNSEGLTVSFEHKQKFFSWFWLRDHAQNPSSFHQYAKQRLVETGKLGQVNEATCKIIDDGSGITLSWPDVDEFVQFTADFLGLVNKPDLLYDVIGHDQEFWDAKKAPKLLHQYDCSSILGSDTIFHDMLESIRLHGMAKVNNIPLDILSAREIMERIGYIRSSIFGDMWELQANGKMDDTGSTSLNISPHTDGTYNHDSPGVMSLFCLKYNAIGGDNILVDGYNILEKIRKTVPKAFELLSTVSIPGQYIGDGAYLCAQRPVARIDENGRFIQISYNNHDRAPFHLPSKQMDELYSALSIFDKMINDQANQFSFALRPGEMIIFDNWRLLHGRKYFTGERHMVGCYINREDFESCLRLKRETPMDMIGSKPFSTLSS